MEVFSQIKTKHLGENLSILIVAILAMALMSGCSASLTDYGYKGGPTTTVNINGLINNGYGETDSQPFFSIYHYDPSLSVYYPYTNYGTFSSSRQYRQR